MMFLYSKWDAFLKKLEEGGVHSITAQDVLCGECDGRYVILKHDVETKPEKALMLAQLEHRRGHRGSYYVQAYILDNDRNIDILRQIQRLGHEVSYHYDVMDSCKGDLSRAIQEFDANMQKFTTAGFDPKTLCQHGNPVIERVGYTSNRDFFRSPKVQSIYPELSDVMVDFKEKANTDYLYFSDAGAPSS